MYLFMSFSSRAKYSDSTSTAIRCLIIVTSGTKWFLTASIVAVFSCSYISSFLAFITRTIAASKACLRSCSIEVCVRLVSSAYGAGDPKNREHDKTMAKHRLNTYRLFRLDGVDVDLVALVRKVGIDGERICLIHILSGGTLLQHPMLLSACQALQRSLQLRVIYAPRQPGLSLMDYEEH